MRGRRGRAANNMGNISLRKDGRWQGRVSLPDGERKYIYASTEQDCVARMQALLNDVRLGVPVPTKDQTLSVFLTDWLENTIKPNRAPSTYSNYKQMVNLYITPALGKLKLTRLTGQDIQRFENQLRMRSVARTGKPMSERTVQLCHGILRAALNKAVKFGLTARNPVLSVDPPQVRRKEVKPLTQEQARVLLHNVRGTRLEAFWTVGISLGVRPGEAFGLDVVRHRFGTRYNKCPTAIAT
jgi:integrase